MAKSNPSRQELLDFINEATSELGISAKKIEDLSSGVQYLHLLSQTHPEIVKMAKVNIKASQEYEFVNNLRFLSSCLADAKAPFNLEVHIPLSIRFKKSPRKITRKISISSRIFTSSISFPNRTKAKSSLAERHLFLLNQGLK